MRSSNIILWWIDFDKTAHPTRDNIWAKRSAKAPVNTDSEKERSYSCNAWDDISPITYIKGKVFRTVEYIFTTTWDNPPFASLALSRVSRERRWWSCIMQFWYGRKLKQVFQVLALARQVCGWLKLWWLTAIEINQSTGGRFNPCIWGSRMLHVPTLEKRFQNWNLIIYFYLQSALGVEFSSMVQGYGGSLAAVDWLKCKGGEFFLWRSTDHRSTIGRSVCGFRN